MRILFIRLSAFGDIVHAVPCLVALRRQMPNAFIGWALDGNLAPLLAGHPMLDKLHSFPGPSRGGRCDPAAINAFRNELAAQKYDVAIDMQDLTKGALAALWTHAPRRIGYAGSTELVCEFESYERPAGHRVEQHLSLLAPLGIEPAAPEWVMPDYSAETVTPFIEANALQRFAIVNPGTTWETKKYPAEKFAAVARELAKSLPVVVTWNGRELDDARQIVETAGAGVILAPKTDMRELGALTRRAAVFVSNDTGPSHLAAALGVPTVAIFGATDPALYAPYGAGNAVFTVPELDCRPCSEGICKRGDFACLNQIDPAAVAEKAAEVAR